MHYSWARIWSVWGLGLLLAHCGVDPARLARQVEAKVLTLATPRHLAQHLVVESSYIVAFRSPAGSTTQHYASFAAEYGHHYSYLADAYVGDPRVRDLRYITAVDLAHPRTPASQQDVGKKPAALQLQWTQNQLDEIPAVLSTVDFASPEAAAAVLKEWEASGAIWFAEPNYYNKLADDSPVSAALVKRYNSAGTSGIWWHKSIKLPQALQKLSTTKFTVSQTPVIAILDSGCDIEHPQLKPHLWTNPSPGSSGCSGDVNGCNTTGGLRGNLGNGDVFPYGTGAYSKACPQDPVSAAEDYGTCGHGTHVAGIVAADFDTASTAAGVCPLCRILPIKVIDDKTGKADDEAILLGFKYLARFRGAQGGVVRVANSSLGKYDHSRSTELVVGVLSEAPNEILVVAAASNDDSMIRSYPAAYGGVIAVSATGPKDEKAAYSNFGPWVTVAAPGGNSAAGGESDEIYSTVPGGTTGNKQGTSMASPVVAGLAGLVLAFDPGRGYQALRDSIINTADPRLYDPSVNNGINLNFYDPQIAGDTGRRQLLGSGIVDAVAALTNTPATTASVPPVRVAPGCGVIGTANAGLSWWWLLLPFLLVFI